MRWQPGRRSGGYEKLTLFQGKKFDCHLIRVKEGAHIEEHRDQVDQGEHHRLNILLWKPKKGGHFLSVEPAQEKRWWRFTKFRPDLYRHRVTRIESGSRLILSFGWIKGL